MTTSTEPTFSYPASNAREFFVKCGKDDPDRGDFWCGWGGIWCSTAQHHAPGNHELPVDKTNCGTIWRKKVQVPDGWEIVPWEDVIPSGYQFYHRYDFLWVKSNSSSSAGSTPEKRFVSTLGEREYFIRPIAEAIPGAMMAPTPPMPHESDLILAMLITGGFVSKEKVEQARAFVRKL